MTILCNYLEVLGTDMHKDFTEDDFKGIINIGVGSKRNDPSKIGKFGKGALTMYVHELGPSLLDLPENIHSLESRYHWTSVPSFISGEYYVIFE